MKIGEMLDVVRDGTPVRIYVYAGNGGCDAGDDVDVRGKNHKGTLEGIAPEAMAALRDLNMENVGVDYDRNLYIMVRLPYQEFEQIHAAVEG